MNAVGEELAILNPPALDPDLEAMSAGTWEVDTGNSVSRVRGTAVCRIWIAWVGHNVA